MALVPLVTVALPVLNGGNLVRTAVRSLVQQSFSDWELLVIDDGSTDGATDDLSALDPRIRLLKGRDTKGLAGRLNEAIQVARGRYVARMDHDDISHPDRLRQQVEYLESHPEIDLLGTRCVALSEHYSIIGVLPGPTLHKDIVAHPWLGFHLAHPTWMGRRSWFVQNPYSDPGPYRCEDQELMLRTYSHSQFAAVPIALLGYRVRTNPSLVVLVRTRLALAKVQARHFWAAGPKFWSVTSYFAAFARIFMDAVRHVTGGNGPARAAATSKEVAEWNAIIEDLKK